LVDIEPVLVAFLLDRDDVTELIGDRLYPQVAPQQDKDTGVGAFPHVTFYRVSTERVQTLEGTASSAPRVQFDCWSKDYPTAKRVGLAIGAALNAFKGSEPARAIRVQRTIVEDEQDEYEQPRQGDEAGIHRVSLTVKVYYSGF
jgi:hypothetical protein